MAELQEQDEAVTIGANGTKAASDAGEAVTRRNGGDVDGDLEDGEVDEDGGLNQTSTRGAGGPVGESGRNSIGLSAKKSTAAGKDEGKAKISTTLADGMPTMLEAADATSPGEADVPFGDDPNYVLYWAPRLSLTACAGQDQVLENMKMAYWWAGYYSGLYEGQQQAKAASTR